MHIGLPITAEFETLDININGQETLLDKKQVIPSVTLVVNASAASGRLRPAVNGTNIHSVNSSSTMILLMTLPEK